MNIRIKILWNVLCRPGSRWSRRLSNAAERMDWQAPQPAADEIVGALADLGRLQVEQRLSGDASGLTAKDVEARVVERTAEFSAANASLQQQVAERQIIEEEIRWLQHRQELIFNSISQGIHWIGPGGDIIYENPASARMLGWGASELIGLPAHATMHHSRADGGEYSQAACPIYKGLQTGLGCHVDDEVFWRKDGTSFPVDYTSTPMCDENGRNLGTVVLFSDITERKEAEEVRREHSALLASAQRIGRMGSWRMHVGAGRLIWSDATCELFGIAPDKFEGTFEFFLSFIVPEDLPAYLAMHALIAPSNTSWEVEYRIRWRNGQVHTMQERGDVEFDASGDVLTRIGMVMDITERKRTEDSFRLLNSAVEQLKESVLITDAELDLPGPAIVFVNRAFTAMTGYTAEEIIGRTPRILQGPLTKRTLMARLRKNLSSGEMFEGETVNYRKDGTAYHLEWQISPLRNAGGRVTHFVAVQRDVTTRNQAAACLAANESLLREFIRHAPAAIAMLDTEMRYIQASERWIQDYKLGGQNIVGISHYEIFPDVPQRWKDIHARVLAGAVERCEEDAFPRADGSIEWLQWEARPWYGGDGKIGGLIFFTLAITERKQAEEELHWKTALLEAQVDSYDVGILVVDGGGRKVLQNRRMADLWEIPPEIAASNDDNVQMQFVLNRTARPDQFIEKVTYLYAHPDERSSDEIELIDGTVLDRYSAPVIGKDGRHYGRIWTFADITGRKRADAERAVLNQQLMVVSRQAGMAEVATNVLHNVGNVLNSVNISCSVIEDKVRKSRIGSVTKTAELLQSHQENLSAFFTTDSAGLKLPDFLCKLSERLLEEQAAIIIELQLLSGNIDHIKQIVAMQQSYACISGVTEIINIPDLIEDGLRMCGEALSRHKVEVMREYGEVPPAAVEKAKVLQILVNLISNAKSACNESSRADKQMTLRLTADAETARISVIDNGIGISPENLTRIFAHGFTTKPAGHGFGLHSSVLAAREMGGDLTVHSEGSGQGSTFILKLPLKAKFTI